MRPPRVLTRSFPLMTVPFTAGAPCSYWTLTCLAVSSALHSLMGFLFVSPVVCLQLPSDSISRWTPLLFGYPLPTAGRGRDFHPLERAPAGRTNEIKHAARVLSRYRDARRTRILRIRLRLTVRVKKPPHFRLRETCGGIFHLYQPVIQILMGRDYIMPIPGFPPAGAAGAGSLIVDTAASVVSRDDATDVAFCRALLVTLAGSRIPASIISTYSSL